MASAAADAEVAFSKALAVAFASAISKFDTLSTYFEKGMAVQEVIAMLVEEMRGDKDFFPAITSEEEEQSVAKFVQRSVGKSYGEWKRTQGKVSHPVGVPVGENPLPWASIDNYPEWVFEQIRCYLNAEASEAPFMQRQLEKQLLETPLFSASVKYDGTSLGLLDTGDLVGRRHVLGKVSSYQCTSTAATGACDLPLLQARLAELLGVALAPGAMCVWGELMCNPGYYGYLDRGFHEQWLPFGVVLQLPEAAPLPEISERLQKEQLAHGFSAEKNRLRLYLCPALRQVLREAKCKVVEVVEHGLSHAQLVAQQAHAVMDGSNEGLVLVFPRGAEASVRKWKNSTEGGVADKHAKLLRSLDAAGLQAAGRLHPEIAQLVGTLVTVAEAKTEVTKVGRKAMGV
ncbi:unnamed protein product [Effrenium voratum]|uniref:Uncharacterized protein n=1 Tax=Effrenium voratum TaxID=2562239 RepID=A0AA36IZC8_9DINO|nr:unnamed protein product [Effrenium voratum]